MDTEPRRRCCPSCSASAEWSLQKMPTFGVARSLRLFVSPFPPPLLLQRCFFLLSAATNDCATWLGVNVEIRGFVKLLSCKQLEFSIFFLGKLGILFFWFWCTVILTAAVCTSRNPQVCAGVLQGNEVLDGH